MQPQNNEYTKAQHDHYTQWCNLSSEIDNYYLKAMWDIM